MLLARLALAAPVLALLAPLAAADILTVGPTGSGAQFTQIQAAVDVAAADDVILVRPGTYARIDVNKPVRILGDGTGVVLISAAEFGARVHDIAAGEELVLSGLEVRVTTFSSNPLVLLRDCPGTVVLQDVNVHGADAEMTGVEIQNCARAMLVDSQIDGWGGLEALDSEVWLASSIVAGGVGYFGDSPTGVSLEGSTLHAWRSRIRGGDGIAPLGPKTGAPGGVGMRALGSSVNLFGGPGSEVLGGRGIYEPAVDFNHSGGRGLVLSQGSSARIQADQLVAGGLDGLGTVQAQDIQADASSSYTLDPKVFPTLASSAQQVQLGSPFTLTLAGNPGGYQVLFLSLRTGPTATYRGVDGFGMLDRANLFKVVSEVLPPSGALAVDVRVPSTTALLGETLFFQAAERFPNTLVLRHSSLVNRFAIGNPVLVTITG